MKLFNHLTDEEREQKFQQRMQALDNKQALRKQKKLDRARSRAAFQKKHPFVHWSIVLLVISVIGYSGYFMYSTFNKLYQQYSNSRKWTKMSDTPLASLDVVTLYATDEEKENRSKLTSLIDQMWDKQAKVFKSEATQSTLDEINKLYDSLTSDKSAFTSTKDEINAVWQAKQKLDALFVDRSRKVVKLDVTSTTLMAELTSAFDLISPYLTNTPEGSSASQQQATIYSLAEESYTLQRILEKFDNGYFMEKSDDKSIEYKTAYTSVEVTELMNEIDQLNYEWLLVTKYIKPVISSSAEVIAKNTDDKSNYDKFTSDQNDEKAFRDYLSSYTTRKDELSKLIIDTPNLAGVSVSEMDKILSDAGLMYEVTYKDVTDPAQADKVISQSPTPEQYKRIVKGSMLKVTIGRQLPTSSTRSSSSSSSSVVSSSSTTSTSSSYESDEDD